MSTLPTRAGDVLVVLVARLGLGDGDLRSTEGRSLTTLNLRDVAAELVQALDRPRAHDAVQVAARDAVFLLQDGAVFRSGLNRPSGDSFTGEPLMA
jgi:hypothetical protein